MLRRVSIVRLVSFAFLLLTPDADAQVVTSIAAGEDFTLFVKADGTLWAVGKNDHGQLGDGTTTLRSIPVHIADGVELVAARGDHALFVKRDGTLWAMGSNESGQLGDGSTTERRSPVWVAEGVASVAPGYFHTLFVKKDGTLWATGDNSDGQLGDGTQVQRNSPVQVASNVAMAAAGRGHSVFVKTDGTLWTMGANGYASFGDGTGTRYRPVRVENGVASVAVGYGCTMFIKTDGTLWAVGSNGSGELGDGTMVVRERPVQVAAGVVSVAAGDYHTMFVKTDGTLWGSGENQWGTLGDGTTVSRSLPVQVADGVTMVAAGTQHTTFVKKDGRRWAMGVNVWFQLGDGTTAKYRTLPIGIAEQWDVFIHLGEDSPAVFTEGDNVLSRPVVVAPALTLVASSSTLASASISIGGAFFVKEDRLDFANNGSTMGDIVGEYADSTGVLTMISPSGRVTLGEWQNALRSVVFTNSSESPRNLDRLIAFVVSDGVSLSAAATRVVGVTPVNDAPSAVVLLGNSVFQSEGASAPVGVFVTTDRDSSDFTYSLTSGSGSKDNMEFYVRGSELMAYNPAALPPRGYSVRVRSQDGGDGSGAEAAFTVTVHPGVPPAVTVVEAGVYHTMVVKADGSLWGMGHNSYGQLGDGTKTARRLPVRVREGVTAVAAGLAHTVFVTNDGTLWGMGRNYDGELGVGTAGERTVPVSVASGVRSVAAGYYHTVFVRNDGTLWAMGKNGSGELGDGTTTTRNLPIQVASGVVSTAAGDSSTFFIKVDGTLWAVGANGQGQLGDGTTAARYTPVQIATEVASVAAGEKHALFVKRDGTLWAMGENGNGQLGDGSIVDRSVPVKVAADVAMVAAGGSHTVFVKTDRTLWAVGDHDSGEDYPFADQSVPVRIGTEVALVSAGWGQTMFVKTDGSLWGMGHNISGELGVDIRMNPPYTPLRVTGAAKTIVQKQPVGGSVPVGQSISLTVLAAGDAPLTYQWQGPANSVGRGSTTTLSNFQPRESGLHYAIITNAGREQMSAPAIVGAASTNKVVGTAVELAPVDISHPNGNVFDQVLLTGGGAAITADYALNQMTRASFVDVDGDIVQVEFSGPGTLSLVLDGANSPAAAANYNQPGVQYVTGHAGIVIVGADERTNVSVFSVGRATAVNQTLFKEGVKYDGIADLAFIAILSTNGKFGGVRTANASYFASQGYTGIYAPGVEFTGPVYLGDVSAFDTAKPVLVLGAASDVRITGGDLLQNNRQPVQVSGITQLRFADGSDSHGNSLVAQPNQAVLQQDGVDVTARIVVKL